MALKYKQYEESDEQKRLSQKARETETYSKPDYVTQSRSKMEANEAAKPSAWNGGTYGEAVQNAIAKIQNREKFQYDLNADALYQQYKDRYIAGGKLAMQDTIGQASALTGGYGNSYAVNAGSQAYQGYLQKLNDVVPELYQLAYQRYQDEGQNLKDQYSILANQYNVEYGENRDAVSDWQNEAQRLANQYYNDANIAYSQYQDQRNYFSDALNAQRSYDYGMYSDAYNRAMAEYQQGVAEDQYDREMALNYAKMGQNQSQWEREMALKELSEQNDKEYRYAALKQENNQWIREMALKKLSEDNDYAYKMAALGAKSKEPDYSDWTEKQFFELLNDVYEKEGVEAALVELRNTGLKTIDPEMYNRLYRIFKTKRGSGDDEDDEPKEKEQEEPDDGKKSSGGSTLDIITKKKYNK